MIFQYWFNFLNGCRFSIFCEPFLVIHTFFFFYHFELDPLVLVFMAKDFPYFFLFFLHLFYCHASFFIFICFISYQILQQISFGFCFLLQSTFIFHFIDSCSFPKYLSLQVYSSVGCLPHSFFNLWGFFSNVGFFPLNPASAVSHEFIILLFLLKMWKFSNIFKSRQQYNKPPRTQHLPSTMINSLPVLFHLCP